MNLKQKIKQRYDWKGYLIACIIISPFAFFIHQNQYQPPQIDVFFMWLPAVWLLTFILMVLITELFFRE